MRIAVYHNLPSGGAKRTLNESARRLATHHHLDVFTLSCANHDFADLRPHVASYKVFDFHPLPLLSSPLGRLNQAIRLADLLRLRSLSRAIARKIDQGDYDVLLAHPCQFETSPTILRYLQSLPSVYYCHEPLRLLYEAMPGRPYDDNSSSWRWVLNRVDPLPALYYSVLKRTDQRNTRSARTVLVNSKFMRHAVRRIYQVDAQVSYHGLDTQLFRPLPVEKRHMLLSVGSLTPLKGFDFLIRSVARIPPDQRPTLVIASNFQNPPERDYLEQLANDLDVDLTLLANVSDERLVQLYNQTKVTVYAPIGEPFGLVPLESMACGTPVIGVAEGGVRETIRHGETGLLTDRQPKQFADAILELLTNPLLAEELGKRGPGYVRDHWNWDDAVARLESHLKAAADGVANPQYMKQNREEK